MMGMRGWVTLLSYHPYVTGGERQEKPVIHAYRLLSRLIEMK